MLEFILNDIKNILDDFHNLTGMPISLYDEDMTAIYHASDWNPLCLKLRGFDGIRKECEKCDAYALETSCQTRKACIYRCHAGLVEANIPICENNVIIGHVRTGQILCDDNLEYTKKTLKKYGKDFSGDENLFLDYLENLPMVSQKKVNSAFHMIEMCASYLYLSNIIKKKSVILTAQLKEFIDNHLSEDLSVKVLCDKMYISRTMLYNLSMKAFGMGSSEYISLKRLEMAESMLKSSDKNIYEIAEECGFKDANYFTKLFKSHSGMTPLKYKKLHRS